MTNFRQKYLGLSINKAASRSEDGTLLVKGFFTSDNVDQVGDLITRKATEDALKMYRQWGNVRYMHQPRPVGKVVRSGERDGLAWNEVEIKVIDPQAVFEVESGLLSALSVGIYVDLGDITVRQDGVNVINRYMLSEISLVDHPANYDAVLQVKTADALAALIADRGIGDIAAEMKSLLEESMDETTPVVEEIQEQPVETVAENKATPECVQEGETDADCVNRKVDELMQANPELPLEEAQTMATGMCAQPCASEEGEEEMEDEQPVNVEGEEPVNVEAAAENEPPAAEDASPDVDSEEPVDPMVAIKDAVETLTGFVSKLEIIERLLPALEALVKAQADGDEQAKSDEQPAEEDDVDPDPVNRKGAIATEPEATTDPEKETVGEAVKGLRSAITKYFETKRG